MAKATKQEKLEALAAELGYVLVQKPVVMVEQTNAMTGKKFMEAEGTPFYASPRSETYWCS